MYDVVTIGTATRDVFLRSPLFRVVHDPEHLQKIGFPTGEAQCFALGGKVEIDAPVMTVGGGAANAAVTFARQNLKTAAFVSLGDDENAGAITSTLGEEGIKLLISEHKKETTAYSTILLSSTGERTILTYRGASERLDPKSSNEYYDARAAYIVPGVISMISMRAILKQLKAQRVFVAMNPSKHYLELGLKKLSELLKFVDVVMVNREEGAYLTGANYEDVKTIVKKFDEIVEGIAVLTDGPNGVWVSDGSRLYHAGTFGEKKLIDRTGAGDAFNSAFAAELFSFRKDSAANIPTSIPREVIEEAIRKGSANATSVVEAIGAQAGILRRKDFETGARWKKLSIEVIDL